MTTKTKDEMLAMQSRIWDLKRLINSGKATGLDEFELEELKHLYHYWTVRNKLTIIEGGKNDLSKVS